MKQPLMHFVSLKPHVFRAQSARAAEEAKAAGARKVVFSFTHMRWTDWDADDIRFFDTVCGQIQSRGLELALIDVPVCILATLHILVHRSLEANLERLAA